MKTEDLVIKVKQAAYRLNAFSEIASKRKEDVLAKAIFEEAAVVGLLSNEFEIRKQIEQAIKDYHYALDMRQRGGAAQDKAFNQICKIVGLHWEQGKERKEREQNEKLTA